MYGERVYCAPRGEKQISCRRAHSTAVDNCCVLRRYFYVTNLLTYVLRIDMVRFNVDVAASDEGLLGPPGYWGQPTQEGGETVNV
jgi:hypothetical protein